MDIPPLNRGVISGSSKITAEKALCEFVAAQRSVGARMAQAHNGQCQGSDMREMGMSVSSMCSNERHRPSVPAVDYCFDLLSPDLS